MANQLMIHGAMIRDLFANRLTITMRTALLNLNYTYSNRLVGSHSMTRILLFKNMEEIGDLVHSGKIDAVMNELPNLKGIDVISRNMSSSHLSEMMFAEISRSDSKVFFWVEFCRRLDALEGLKGTNFISNILFKLEKKIQDPQLLRQDHIHAILHGLIEICDDKLSIIKQLSATKFGNALLEKSMISLIKDGNLPANMLHDLRVFF